LETVCQHRLEHSNALTGVLMPAGHDADRLRAVILERFDLSLGTGLGKLKGKAFRIGHLGDFNDLMLSGTLCGVEMGLGLAGVPHTRGGVAAALDYLQAGSSRGEDAAEDAWARGFDAETERMAAGAGTPSRVRS
jgi:alanine-glyoxylate transaminase/serine-glyoxylate transaminase/serine-pyruvate transaminase